MESIFTTESTENTEMRLDHDTSAVPLRAPFSVFSVSSVVKAVVAERGTT